jgi:hypothetical protein
VGEPGIHIHEQVQETSLFLPIFVQKVEEQSVDQCLRARPFLLKTTSHMPEEHVLIG